nr:hypothetical protein [Ktedonobacteraceae bacterium]
GAFIGGALVLVCVNIPLGSQEQTKPWGGRERLAWILIGLGCIAWGIGECFWRYYLSQGQTPFPSLADFGYASLPPLFFVGLILQPFSKSGGKRTFLLLDSLIAMGALLSIAWFLLLGSLAQTPSESVLAKSLGLYYATADVALLSCTLFLLLRGSGTLYNDQVRRISLLLVALGISIFAISDFLFNVLNNLGLPVDGTWVDLGWPLGLMTVGIAAYLRRFFIASGTMPAVEEQEIENIQQFRFGPIQIIPYLLLVLLFLVLTINVFSSDKIQQSIRPVLVVATLIVVGLVIMRQIFTALENVRLIREQIRVNNQLETVYQDSAKRKAALEAGVTYLKEIQARLANGDVRARAQISNDDLWPLATGLNLMADRLLRSETNQAQVQRLLSALSDFNQALERTRGGHQFVLPPSCQGIPALQQLVYILSLRGAIETTQVTPSSEPPRRPDNPRTYFSSPPAPSQSLDPDHPKQGQTKPYGPGQWPTK